eukprot:jgi/Mesvir1/8612/Mv04944-RA.1
MDTLAFMPAVWAMDVLARKRPALLSLSVLGLGYFLLPLWGHTIAGMTVAVAVQGLGSGLAGGIALVLGTDLAPPAASGGRAKFLSLWRLLVDFGLTKLNGTRAWCDVDASVALFDARYACVDMVWFRKKESKCGSITHSGDDLTGEGGGDDEIIKVKLDKLPKHVHRILCVVCVFSSSFSFANVRSCKVRLHHGNPAKNFVICEYVLSGQPCESMCMCVMVRRGEYWTVHALGLPTKGKTLEQVVQHTEQLGPVMQIPSFDPHYRRVTVIVLRGEGLAAKDGGIFRAASSDPFYKVKFKNSKYQSEVVKKTLDPVWREHPLPLGLITSVDKKAVKITVWDEDLHSGKDFMGAVFLPSSVIYAAGPGIHQWHMPLSMSKKSKYAHAKVKGKLVICVRVEDVPPGQYH